MPYETVTFDDIPVVPYRHHSGTFIPTVSPKLKLLIEKVTDLLMPNDLMGKIRCCKTVAEFDALLLENEHCFDTFHYGIGGIFYKKIFLLQDW